MRNRSLGRPTRRSALTGREAEVRRLPEEMLRANPQDAEAAAESERLKSGQTSHVTETGAARKARKVKDARRAISELLAAYPTPAQSLATVSGHTIRRLHRDLRARIGVLRRLNAPAPVGTGAFLAALEDHLRRRRRRSSRRLLRALCVFSVVLPLLVGTGLLLRNRAARQTARLAQALDRSEWNTCTLLLPTVNTGINRLLCPECDDVVRRTYLWQKKVSLEAARLSNILSSAGQRATFASLPLEERAGIRRSIRKLPVPFSTKLMQHWDALCLPEQEMLRAQRDELVQRLTTAVEPAKLSGNLAQDIRTLRALKEKLTRICVEFADAEDTFDLPDTLIAPNKKTLEETKKLLVSAESTEYTSRMLDTARSYKEHLQALRAPHPLHYAPAPAAEAAAEQLPSEKDMAGQLRELRHNVPANPPPYMLSALLHAGPSFCRAAPATVEQLHLMEDIFDTAFLRVILYEVRTADGLSFFTENYPAAAPDGSLSFVRSSLDPTLPHTAPGMTKLSAGTVTEIRTVDATVLLRSTGLDRATLFLQGNLPELLGKITSVKTTRCPALAKAYTYSMLAELLRLHTRQEITGLRYSPTLQADTQSFRNLVNAQHIKLAPGCWLNRDTATLRAEQAFAAWFTGRADRDYCAEISRNFRSVLTEPMRYVGYVGSDAAAHLKAGRTATRTLHYFSERKLISTPVGAPLSNPDIFSPLFAD